MPIERGLSAKVLNERLSALGDDDWDKEAPLKQLKNENMIAITDGGGIQHPLAIMDEDDGMEMTKAASDDEGKEAIGKPRLFAVCDGSPPVSEGGLVHAPPSSEPGVAAPGTPPPDIHDAPPVIDYGYVCGIEIAKRASYMSSKRRQAARWTLMCPYKDSGHDQECRISRSVQLDPDRYSGCCRGPFFLSTGNQNMFGDIVQAIFVPLP